VYDVWLSRNGGFGREGIEGTALWKGLKKWLWFWKEWGIEGTTLWKGA